MKRLLLALLFAGLALSGQAQKKDTLRVLAIGNSFSVDAIENNLYDLAASDGHCIIIGNMYIGGCSLQRHYNNSITNSTDYSYRKISADGVKTVTPGFTLEKALADEKWDYVSFQQSSPLSGILPSYEPYLTDLLAYVKERVPKDVKFLFHQTWAYAADASHKNFVDYDRDQMKMYNCIMYASSETVQKYRFTVIPCGTTQQNLRQTLVGDKVNRDGYHLNSVGRYAAACTWYEVLYNADVRENRYFPKDMNEHTRDAVQAAAHAAVRGAYKITDVGHREAAINYDESKIPAFTPDDPLTMIDGRKVTSAKMWKKERRPELLELFCKEEYGFSPVGKPKDLHFKVVSCTDTVFAGTATRKEVNVYFDKSEEKYMTLLMYVPNGKKHVPAFLGLNFRGNYTTTSDPAVLKPDSLQVERFGRYEDLERGSWSTRWPYEMAVRRGYAVVTVFHSDIDPDWDDRQVNGVHSLYPELKGDDSWGTLAAWAWGLSRALDYLEKDKDIDAGKVAVIGHSRHGKAALWAGATDPRFALVISNNSGCGGAALSKRAIGENVERINSHFPHWFCKNFRVYNSNEQSLPFDQHELLALIAPRPLYVASSSLDKWADPRGEFLGAWYASSVYELLGYPGLVVPGYAGGEPKMPEIEQPLQKGRIAYHIKEGKHSITDYDWTQYMNFADKFFK